MKTMTTEAFIKKMGDLEEDLSFAIFAVGYVKAGHVTIMKRKNQPPALYGNREELEKIQAYFEDQDDD